MSAAALPLAAAATAMQIVGGVKQGQAASAAGKFNQQQAEADARETEMLGAAEAERARREARAAMGEQLAAQGASGLALGTGTNLEMLRESALNAELDVLMARRNASQKATALRTQGALARAEGKHAKTAAFIGAAASALTTASSYANGARAAKAGG